jgi:hypothetical protein
MKKIFLLSAMAVLMLSSVVTLNSCKKGADDPAISLRSRTSRLAGKWTISAGTENSVSVNGANTSTSTTTINSTTITQVSNNTTTTGTIAYTVEFVKDGTYTMTRNETYTGYSYNVTSTGTWNFVAGGNDLKNKEAIILTEKNSTRVSSYGTSSNTNVSSSTASSYAEKWIITRLANSELVVTANDNSVNGSNSDNNTVTYTFVQ